jgi:hypothetical protein
LSDGAFCLCGHDRGCEGAMIAGGRWNADGGGHGWIWREITAGQPGSEKSRQRSARDTQNREQYEARSCSGNRGILTPR